MMDKAKAKYYDVKGDVKTSDHSEGIKDKAFQAKEKTKDAALDV